MERRIDSYLIEDYLRHHIMKEWLKKRIGLDYSCVIQDGGIYHSKFKYFGVNASGYGATEDKSKYYACLELFKELQKWQHITVKYVLSHFNLPLVSDDYCKQLANFFEKLINFKSIPHRKNRNCSFFSFFIGSIEIQLIHENPVKAYKLLYHYIRDKIIELLSGTKINEEYDRFIKRIAVAKTIKEKVSSNKSDKVQNQTDQNKPSTSVKLSTHKNGSSIVSPTDNVSSSTDLARLEQKSREYIRTKGLGLHETFLINLVKNLESIKKNTRTKRSELEVEKSADKNDQSSKAFVANKNSLEQNTLSETINRSVCEFIVTNGMDNECLEDVQAICLRKILSKSNPIEKAEIDEMITRICENYFKGQQDV